ncbi:MAG: O-antigen ligase family protein [Proteobacteria bacterium]|nr:O-antigen ligase family protein [Pseudomonadota bacterium]
MALALGRPDRAAAALLTLAGLVLGPLALLAPLGLAPLLTVVAVGLGAIAALERRWPVPSVDLATALALLAGLALASALWAIDPAYSLTRALRFVAECVEGLLLVDAAARLAPAARRQVLGALALGLGLTVGLAVVDWALAGGLMRGLHGAKAPPTATNRGATVLALMMWPVVLFVRHARGYPMALVAWAVAAVGIAACLSASAHVALAVATVTFALTLWLRRAAVQVALVLVPVAVLTMPLLPLLSPPSAPLLPAALLKPSAMHRLVIWHFTDVRISERPLLGWGLDAARAIPGGKDIAVVRDRTGQPISVEQLPLHPHNGALQVWLELGAVGALLGALVATIVAMRLAGPLPPVARAAGLATFAAAAVEVSLSYGIWQSWWIAALWLAGFAVAVALKDAATPADAARPRD